MATPCISLSGINVLLSLGILLGFLAKEKVRNFFKKNSWIGWLIGLLIISGAIQLKITCP